MTKDDLLEEIKKIKDEAGILQLKMNVLDVQEFKDRIDRILLICKLCLKNQ